jgi:hypothetical protein
VADFEITTKIKVIGHWSAVTRRRFALAKQNGRRENLFEIFQLIADY